VVDFLFAIIELISLALTVQTLQADIGQHFAEGVGHFKLKFHVEGDIAHQPMLVSEN